MNHVKFHGQVKCWALWHKLHFYHRYSVCYCNSPSETQNVTEAINNNSAVWGPDLVLVTVIPSTALPPMSSTSKNDSVFWPRHKEHLRGIRKKGTALTEHFRQHLKDCITQLWVMWQPIFCQASCVDEHCLPLCDLWVRATAKSLSRS